MAIQRTGDRRHADRRTPEDSSKLAKLQADSSMMDEYLREQFGDDEQAIDAWIDRMQELQNRMWRARGWTPAIYE